MLNSIRNGTHYQAYKGIVLKQQIISIEKDYSKGLEGEELRKIYNCVMAYKNKVKKFRLKFRFKMVKRATFLSIPHVLTLMEMNADRYKEGNLMDFSEKEKEIAREHYEVLIDMFGENYSEAINEILSREVIYRTEGKYE